MLLLRQVMSFLLLCDAFELSINNGESEPNVVGTQTNFRR